MVPEPGARVSHYRLIRRLGTGGMGEVFLAHDDKLDRSVAIKFLLGDSDDRARKRLLTEARAVAALDHPNICSIHEIDVDEWLGDFIVMQYIEGEPLSARLQRGRLLPGEALGVCARVADALRAAHARGIIHRDLKPQNVMLTTSGDPKLLDFGLAKNVASAPAAAAAGTATQLTGPHAVLGTAGYMAPEQVRGQPTDHRSDLFALGCVLYECLTGKRAFTGATAADIHAHVLHSTPPTPSTVVNELDPSHDALVARLLEKDPAQRFQSAEEALGALRVLDPSRRSGTGIAMVSGSGIAPAPPRSRARTVAIVSAIAVGITALTLYLGPWFRRLPEAPAEARTWYDRGVDAIREGRFWTAKTNLEEAVNKFSQYALAHLRLAEAKSELDDAAGASVSLNRASDAVPYGTSLTKEQQLRTAAIRSSVLRKHDEAIEAYRGLVAMNDGDPSAWLDLGRAQEASGRRTDALESYEKALAINSQYAAAHLRIGMLRALRRQTQEGVAAFDEAIRMYHAAGQSEGEVEALLRKAQTLTNARLYADSRIAVDRAIPMISQDNIFQRVRAQFELARLTSVTGNYADAEAMSRKLVDQAQAAGLYETASQGLTDFGGTLIVRDRFDEAASILTRAIDLAVKHEAKRTEMRARMQQASLLARSGQHEAAINAARQPLKFYAEQGFPRAEADGKNILVRVFVSLERYAEATPLTKELLAFAQATKDDVLLADSLEGLAGQLDGQGRLPEALEYQQQLEQLYREQKHETFLPYALNNKAQFLIRLGRGGEAAPILDGIEQQAKRGNQSYVDRMRRVAMLQAMRACIEERFHQVETWAVRAMGNAAAAPDENYRWGQVLREYAKARQGTSHEPVAVVVRWPDDVTDKPARREMTYWVVQTLLSRGDRQEAVKLAISNWQDKVVGGNDELRWRFGALVYHAQKSEKGLTQPNADGATIRAGALRAIQSLKAAWQSHADRYLARPDLAALLQRLQ